MSRDVAGLSRALGLRDRLRRSRLQPDGLRRIRPPARNAAGPLHARRSARSAPRRARAFQARQGRPFRTQRRRVDRTHPCWRSVGSRSRVGPRGAARLRGVRQRRGVRGAGAITADYETTNLRERLARYHGSNTDAMFRTWSDVWLSSEFREWNIEEYLPAIECPVLVIQGEDDAYGTLRQVDAVVTQVSGPAESLILEHCGHSPHSEQPDEVLEAAARFVRKTLVAGR